MATIRPTLQQILDRVHADTVSRLDSESLRRSDIAVFERVIAGASHALYSAIEYGRKQLFLDSCETSYLERLASIFGLSRKGATRSEGEIKFTFASSAVDVPVGTIVQTSDGIQFETTQSPSSDGKTHVKSVLSGADFTAPVSSALSLPTPIAGVSGAVVSTAIVGGTDEESDESLRERALEHTRNPPRQGSKTDYVLWAKEVDGVGKAWCYPKEYGDGTVTVRFLNDEMGIPNAELVAKVQSYLETQTNVMATVYAEAPIEQKINFTLKLTPDSLANRTAVENAIKELFRKESVPGGGIYLSHINAAISAVSVEEDHTIVSPVSDITATGAAYLPVVGVFTWQED